MLKKQRYRCAICKKHRNLFKRSLHVDHDHKTGKIRGLLCYACNREITRDLKFYQKVVKYLKRSG